MVAAYHLATAVDGDGGEVAIDRLAAVVDNNLVSRLAAVEPLSQFNYVNHFQLRPP